MRNWIAQLAFVTCCVSGVGAQDPTDRTILVRSVQPAASSPTVQAYGITREDLRLIRSLAPSIQTLIPIRNVPRQLVRVGRHTIQSTITGTTNDYVRGKSLEIVRGRFLSAKDVANRNNVAVINADQAKKLFPNRDPIGEAIQFHKEFFTVVGIAETNMPPSIYIPYTTMRSRLGDRMTLRNAGAFELRHYELSEIEVVLLAKAEVFQTIEIIKHILQKNHSKRDYEVKAKQ